MGRSATNGNGTKAANVVAPHPFLLLRAMLRTLLLLLLVAAVVYWLICAFGAITAHDLGNDFLVYFSAALALRDNPHANIFDLRTLQNAAAAYGVPMPTLLYLYPPLLAILLIPLTFLPYSVALFAWTLLSLALWALGTIMLVQWARAIVGGAPSRSIGERGAEDSKARNRRRAQNDLALFASTVTVLFSASFFPLLYGVINGQVTSLIFMLSLLALALLPRHPRLAGASLALATWIKLFPVVLVGYFLLRRRWRIMEGAALAAVLLAVLALLVVGWQGLLASTGILANGSAMANAPYTSLNLSLALVPLWIALALGGEPSQTLTLLGSAITATVGVIFVAGVFARVRDTASDEPPTNVKYLEEQGIAQRHLVDLLGISWGLCTMVLLSPVAWMHTYAWLLPPCIICLSVTLRLLIESRPDVTTDALEIPAKRSYADLLALIVLIVLLGAFASLAVPAYTQPVSSLSVLFHEQPLNLPLLLLHPIGALLLWSVNGLLFSRFVRNSMQRAPMATTIRIGNGEGSTTRETGLVAPSAHFLALALMALFIVVGAVEMFYWSIFLVVSTR